MGAIVYETGGLLIDHGWLRILGSGHARLPRSIASWNQGRTIFGDVDPPGYLLVADDVVGGLFAINGGQLGPKRGFRGFSHLSLSEDWRSCQNQCTQG